MAKLVSAKDLAPMLDVDIKTLLKWGRSGILPRIVFTKRCVKFDPDECKKAIEKRTSYKSV